MSYKIDLTGQQFGRLTVIERDTSSKRSAWFCRCSCGNIKSVQMTHLRSGATTSCGCYQKERASKSNLIHGGSRTSLHNRWKAMRQRCNNPNDRGYANYGGRGIALCNEWNDYKVFEEWSKNNSYSEELELDRIDNDKGYSPDNCRWVKRIVNNHNRRTTAKIEGVPLRDFSKKYNMKYFTVHDRYYRLKKEGITPTTESIINFTHANQLPIIPERV